MDDHGLQARISPFGLESTSSIGYLVGGGLKENLRFRLTIPSQEVQEGAFVVIRSAGWQFYGLVTDLQLGATDPRFLDRSSERRPFQAHGRDGRSGGYSCGPFRPVRHGVCRALHAA